MTLAAVPTNLEVFIDRAAAQASPHILSRL